jgi:hypothetical protein
MDIIFKLFGGNFKSLLNSLILAAVVWGVAEVAKLSPEIANTINVNEVAGYITSTLFILINVATNKTHSKVLEDLNSSLQNSTNAKEGDNK